MIKVFITWKLANIRNPQVLVINYLWLQHWTVPPLETSLLISWTDLEKNAPSCLVSVYVRTGRWELGTGPFTGEERATALIGIYWVLTMLPASDISNVVRLTFCYFSSLVSFSSHYGNMRLPSGLSITPDSPMILGPWKAHQYSKYPITVICHFLYPCFVLEWRWAGLHRDTLAGQHTPTCHRCCCCCCC